MLYRQNLQVRNVETGGIHSNHMALNGFYYRTFTIMTIKRGKLLLNTYNTKGKFICQQNVLQNILVVASRYRKTFRDLDLHVRLIETKFLS